MAKNIKFMNLEELRALAKERGIKVPDGSTSKQIRAVLEPPQNPEISEKEKPKEYPTYDEKLKNEPRLWVRVFNRDLDEGVDFGFTFERHRWHLINGAVVKLPVSVIEHLKGVHYPQVRYEQGEAGQTVKVEGSYHRFAITNVDEPDLAKV
jgi:hypothetical protein